MRKGDEEMRKRKKNYMLYGVYEKDDSEECVFVGTMKEVAEKFNVTQNAVFIDVARKRKLNWRYIVKKLGKELEL